MKKKYIIAIVEFLAIAFVLFFPLFDTFHPVFRIVGAMFFAFYAGKQVK